MKLIIALFLISNIAFSSGFIKGKGKFYSSKKDAGSFVKKQLLYESFKDVIGKALVAAGFDTQKFWKSYDEKLNEKLENIKTEYEASYKDKKKDEDFYSKLRFKKLSYRVKYGRLSSYISSYAINRSSRSSHDPNMRYMRIEAKVYSKSLPKLFYKFVGSDRVVGFDTLLLSVDYTNNFFDYNAIGVANENDFTEVVNNHWKEWFEKNKPGFITNVNLISNSELLDIEKKNYSSDDKSSNKVLLLKIQVNMKKLESNTELEKLSFNFEINGYVEDGSSNRVLSSFSVKDDEKTYVGISADKISSAVANHLYRLPMGEFVTINRSVAQFKQRPNQISITLSGYSSIAQVEKYRSALENRGVKFFLKSKVKSFSSGLCTLELRFDGQVSDLKVIHDNLGSDGQKVSFLESENGISVKFK